MMIPCLCSFAAPISSFSGFPANKKRTRTLFRKESGSGTNCMVVNRHMVIRTLMQSSSAFRKEPFPQSLSSWA